MISDSLPSPVTYEAVISRSKVACVEAPAPSPSPHDMGLRPSPPPSAVDQLSELVAALVKNTFGYDPPIQTYVLTGRPRGSPLSVSEKAR